MEGFPASRPPPTARSGTSLAILTYHREDLQIELTRLTVLKNIHVVCAYATGIGFLLRGVLSVNQSSLLKHKVIRTVPHIVDTLLLGSAVSLLYIWSLSPLELPWLIAKITALLVYIAFGFVMLRFGSTARRRWFGFVGGLLTYAYIVKVAHQKTPFPFLDAGL